MALRSFLNGVLFAETYGSGTPKVLALHGWGRRGNDFAASLDGLDALALDLPGFGASPAPELVIGADGYADIVAQTLDFFDRPPVLVGHSFGGRIAVCLAAKNPELVGDLVLTGVPLVRLSKGKKPSVSYRIARRMNDLGVLSNERMEVLKRSQGSTDYRAATGVMRDILVKVINESYEEEMAMVRSHVELIWGEDDDEVPLQVARTANTLFSDSTLSVVPGVGHMVPTTAPDRLRRSIEALV